MLTFQNLRDLDRYHPTLANHIAEDLPDDCLHETFMWSIGGDVFVLEDASEWDYLDSESRFEFDVWEEVNDEWIMAVAINNNSGGPTYFIPKFIITEEHTA
jgi:hypothetical protein